MKRHLLVSLLMLALLPAHQTTHAQNENITLERMIVRVWPEFDEPSALVFYTGSTTADATPPVQLTFPVPPGAEVNAVATQSQGQLFDAEFTVEGDQVTMTSDNGSFHIEFYDPALNVSTAERQYQFSVEAPYAINQFIWGVQVPPSASNFTANPAETNIATDQFGLTVYESVQENVSAGEALTVGFTYQKGDNTFTADLLSQQQQQQQQQQAPPPQQPTPSSSADVPWGVIAGVIIVGVGVAAFFVLQRGQMPFGQKQIAQARTPPASKRGGQQRYCTNCGAEVNPGDKFCRDCGEKLRSAQ